MLYDDANQVEVRYVISLAHHDVSICGGEGDIPEGEVWLKRNAICLSRKLESLGDLGGPTPPFFFFSENLSDKEDFYFALLQNQAKMWDAADNLPKVQPFEVKDIVTLVRRLHSSEEQLQTRWINAVLGRLFLALYKTPEMEEFVRAKITKKISRVNKPNFISKIGLQNIDMGEGAPFITNPRLKDLTVDGNCCIETNLEYSGNFRVEISATVRIDLGPRFKAREVDIVLAVVLKKLEGHLLLRFKPPPSNRVWMSFETMPNMDMDIEPIVSSKQITYGIILRTIESRIREVVAESIVLPFWDDIPFLDTFSQPFRGGIWKREIPKPGPDAEIPDESQQKSGNKGDPLNVLKSKDDRTMSMPVLSESSPGSLKPRKGSKASISGASTGGGGAQYSPSASSSSIERPPVSPLPPGIRSRTFSNAADPVVTADNVKVDKPVSDNKAEEKSSATSAMIEISNRSPPDSPDKSLGTSPIDGQGMSEAMNPSRRGSTLDSTDGTGELSIDSRPSSAHHTSSSSVYPKNVDRSSSTTSIGSAKSRRRGTFETFTKSITMSSTNSDDKPQGPISFGAATAAAKKWGMNMFGKGEQQQQQQQNATEDPPRPAGTPEEPIGRGHPIPPLGSPLAPPLSPKKNTSSTKRKPVPSPPSQDQPQDDSKRPSSRPSFPRRKPVSSSEESQPDELLVIEAPLDSGPDSPIVGKPPSQEFNQEQEQEQEQEKEQPTEQNQSASDGDSHKTTTPGQPNTNNHEPNRRVTPEPQPPTPHGMEILSATDGFFP